MQNKKGIIASTIQVGSSTLLSRLLGLVREILMAKYLGVGVISDAFITAFKIPNSLRKIFAEGALSAAFIPTFVSLVQQGKKEQVNRIMTLSFLFIQGSLIVLCLLMFWKADIVMRIIVPGWYSYPEYCAVPYLGIPFLDSIISTLVVLWNGLGEPVDQVIHAIRYLRILLAFIVFLSSSALLAGALQAMNHFFIPAFAPVLLNIVFIGALSICLALGLSVDYLCYFILCGGLIQFATHVYMYWKLQFRFAAIDKQTWQNFVVIMKKFFPCFLAMSIMEIYFFIDSSIASFLPQGSVTLIYYANRFMGIPLGVFGVAFATILFPHFSRVSVYAPKRLQFYLYEAAKLIFWVTVPIALIMSFLSEKIFYTLFLSRKFTLSQVQEAGHILIAFLIGLFFFSLYKIILNIYYALHETRIPLYISIFSVIVNFILSYYIFMPMYGAFGIALATSITVALQTLLAAWFLQRFFGFCLYYVQFFEFVGRFFLQVGIVSSIFWVIYVMLTQMIILLPQIFSDFFLYNIGFWLWAGPLTILMIALLYITRKYVGIRVYFLEDL